ncbi:haloacid dehalogenase-like hydrolase [Candidatus Pacearchaeota archaeon]|nr:haloacid dehalogenase-like hydrolase [Candidatus Pacearchaeota archaeon]
MPENIIIPNPDDLKEKKKKILEDGADKFHVLADFDRTLTKAFVEGQKTSTVIAQIRNGNYLTPDYASKAHELFDKYHPIEINPNISDEEKHKKMNEWWKTHFELLIKSGLNKKVMEEIVAKKGIEFRDGALGFIDFLHNKNIPLIIMSAGPGDMIKEYLRQEKRLYENIHVIANLYEFDKNGRVTKIKEPIIHSLNKHETSIKGLPIYNALKKRTNVLLLGDGIGDMGMIEGFNYDNLIKVGFLNYNVEESLEKFKQGFDVVITDDGDFGFVNEFLKGL